MLLRLFSEYSDTSRKIYPKNSWILFKFYLNFPNIFLEFSREDFLKNFIKIFYQPFIILCKFPKIFSKHFLNGKILVRLIIISIITFLYTFHTLPLEFLPFAPFCQYSFQTKNIAKRF